MDNQLTALLIEQKREQMHQYASLFGFTHEKTIQCSQELDLLLNNLTKERTRGNSKRYSGSFFMSNKPGNVCAHLISTIL
ncbi:hypothetical protein Q75_13820 [Bacillus coahuilensis p1.1.43]|uniref:Aspartyl-phosphate phosphatase Spo0E family protein n=1 Tax=Bacillus coahuilensis p1.1.43 TaxID=1150625 RepID=A0A147K5K3_9BACI|nr:aspartyl-phosphate phosphatase Spo0E family protein [Bacillus coahuilensis]KUP04907.1 hypothetical protein Q75_13820 [Bacillus coahuilensis p1.1.43]